MKTTRLLIAGAAAAAVLAPATTAFAEIPLGTMTATPNPVDVGQTVTVANVDEPGSTCEGGIVNYQILGPDSGLFEIGGVIPDGSGNWSFSFTPDMAGTYIVQAFCDEEIIEEAFPPVDYGDLTVLAQAPGTTTTMASTSTTQASTTTSAAAAAVVTPAFTG